LREKEVDEEHVLKTTTEEFYFHLFGKYLMYLSDKAGSDGRSFRIFVNFAEEYLIDPYIESNNIRELEDFRAQDDRYGTSPHIPQMSTFSSYGPYVPRTGAHLKKFETRKPTTHQIFFIHAIIIVMRDRYNLMN
jgi:hypothetical protein